MKMTFKGSAQKKYLLYKFIGYIIVKFDIHVYNNIVLNTNFEHEFHW